MPVTVKRPSQRKRVDANKLLGDRNFAVARRFTRDGDSQGIGVLVRSSYPNTRYVFVPICDSPFANGDPYSEDAGSCLRATFVEVDATITVKE